MLFNNLNPFQRYSNKISTLKSDMAKELARIEADHNVVVSNLRAEAKANNEFVKTMIRSESRKCRAMIKVLGGRRIHVVFICHLASVWGSLESVYHSLEADPEFQVTVIVTPYRHSSFGDLEFHDGDMLAYCGEKEIPYVKALDDSSNWLNLETITPDYVFFQTPYDDQFPAEYHAASVSRYAKVCYVPYYGVMIYKGDVDAVTHPEGFFRYIEFAFVGEKIEKENLRKRIVDESTDCSVVVTGSPKLDYIFDRKKALGTAWPRQLRPNVTKVLWTPRWHTSEGNCHFFDYNDHLLDFVKNHPNLDFVFRPHPLCLQNFLRTGELSQPGLDAIIARYAALPNADIDRSGDYQDTFRTCDILVSDMSSMMHEFFMTGKPIVYTHRIDCFNEYGSMLAEGFYWVRNAAELDQTLEMLLKGEDPLAIKRQSILERMQGDYGSSASQNIKKILRNDFLATAGYSPDEASWMSIPPTS